MCDSDLVCNCMCMWCVNMSLRVCGRILVWCVIRANMILVLCVIICACVSLILGVIMIACVIRILCVRLPDTARFRHTNAHILTHEYTYIQISLLPISTPKNMQMYLHIHNHTCKPVYYWRRWWRATTWYHDISRPARFGRYIILGYVHIYINTHVQRHVCMYDIAAAFSYSEDPWYALWCRFLSAYQPLQKDLICKTYLRG